MEDNNLILTEYKGSIHNCSSFSCGEKALDDFIVNCAELHQAKGLSAIRILLNRSTSSVLGFSAIAPQCISLDSVPKKLLEEYPSISFPIPCWIIGRLAVAKDLHGKGLGEILLLDAICDIVKRARGGAGSIIILDAKNKKVKKFYKKYNFKSFQSNFMRMFITMEDALELAKRTGISC